MFRQNYPVAWTFHRNTCRWPFNVQAMPDTPGFEPHYKEYYRAPLFPLPDVALPETSLKDAIESRLSCRKFASDPLTSVQLATVLKAAYGVQGRLYLGDSEFLERTVPSGGGLYPLELYLLVQHVADLEPGIYHYSVLQHALEQIEVLQLPRPLVSRLFMGQPYAAAASVIIVFTAVIERSLWKYRNRGYRYILMEAGHAAQNVNLVASALELGSLNLGGFFDSELADLLSLDIDAEVPLYGIAVGAPATEDRMRLRQPLE
jgi:SagB-type dehydrogenase family enzyme